MQSDIFQAFTCNNYDDYGQRVFLLWISQLGYRMCNV